MKCRYRYVFTAILCSATFLNTFGCSQFALASQEPQGHVPDGQPANDDVSFLFNTGLINAALFRYLEAYHLLGYEPTEKDLDLIIAITRQSVVAETLAAYSLIEPVIIKNETRGIADELAYLADPETIATIYDFKNQDRDAMQKILGAVEVAHNRLESAVHALDPSLHQTKLASSAILREAGNYLKKGLAESGEILDVQAYAMGVTLVPYAADSLDADMPIDFCDESRNARDDWRDFRGQIYDLEEKLRVSGGRASKGNASDVYALARVLEQAAIKLPEKDEEICE